MKVLLTGASGFLGKYILKSLQSNGHQVDTLGRHNKDMYKVDFMNDIKSIEKQYDLVIHAAGKAHMVPRTEAEKRAFFDINHVGTTNLLKALSQYPPKYFVFLSTIAVYGLDYGNTIKETQPLNATEPYGLSKKLAETSLLKWCTENKCIATIFRLPLVVAKDAPGNLGAMINAIKKGRYFRVGKGDSRKSMVLAEDIADIILKAAAIGGIYNLTDGCHPSFCEIEEAIGNIFNKRIRAIPSVFAKVIGYSGDIVNLVIGKRIFPLDTRAYIKITLTLTLDDSLAKDNLGWKPNSVLSYLKNNISKNAK